MKNKEQELQKTGQLKLITDALPISIAYLDSNLNYKLANKAYITSHDIRDGEIIGKPLKDIIGANAFRKFNKHVVKVFKGHYVEYSNPFISPEGTKYNSEVQLIPHMKNKVVAGMFIVINPLKKTH